STVSDPAEANVSSRTSQTPARSFPQFCCRHQSSESNRWGAGEPPKPDRTCPGVAVTTPTATNTQDTSDFIVISLSGDFDEIRSRQVGRVGGQILFLARLSCFVDGLSCVMAELGLNWSV